jgi:hypothetical protein
MDLAQGKIKTATACSNVRLLFKEVNVFGTSTGSTLEQTPNKEKR